MGPMSDNQVTPRSSCGTAHAAEPTDHDGRGVLFPAFGDLLKFDARQMHQETNTEPNQCRKAYGPGPAGRRCKHCAHLRVKTHRRNYFKCAKRGITNGPATDHRINWWACGKFELAAWRMAEEVL